MGEGSDTKSVLQSVPIYVLSTIIPHMSVVQELKSAFAKFVWHKKELGRSKHWSTWDKNFWPKDEGGLGFKSIVVVVQAMHDKLWWRFRTQNNSLTNSLWN